MTLLEKVQLALFLVQAFGTIVLIVYAWQTKRMADATKRMADEAQEERRDKAIEEKMLGIIALEGGKTPNQLAGVIGISAKVLVPKLIMLSSPLGPLHNHGYDDNKEIVFILKTQDELNKEVAKLDARLHAFLENQ